MEKTKNKRLILTAIVVCLALCASALAFAGGVFARAAESALTVEGKLEWQQYVPSERKEYDLSALTVKNGEETVTVTHEMLDFSSVDVDTAGDYTAKITVGEEQAEVPVTIKASSIVEVTNVSEYGGSLNLWGINEANLYTDNPGLGDKQAKYVDIRMAVNTDNQPVVWHGGLNTSNFYIDGHYGATLFVKGDMVTVHKGFPKLPNIRTNKTVSFIFNGGSVNAAGDWLKVVEPEGEVTIENKDSLSVDIGKTLQLNITGADGATKMFVADDDGITVTDEGVITGIKAGTSSLTAFIGTKAYKVNVEVTQTATITDVEVTGQLEAFQYEKAAEVDYDKLTVLNVFDDGTKSPLTVKPEMFTFDGVDFNTAGEKNVPFNSGVDGATVNEVKLVLKENAELTVASVYYDGSNYKDLAIEFNGTSNTVEDAYGNISVLAEVRKNMNGYIELNHAKTTTNNAVEYRLVQRNIFHVYAAGGFDNTAFYTPGDTVTVKEGLRFLRGERINETVKFMYRGGDVADKTNWVKITEPAGEFAVENENDLKVTEGRTIQINVTGADDATKIFIANDDGITVSDTGLVTGVKAGTSKLTLYVGSQKKELTITVNSATVSSVSVTGEIEVWQYADLDLEADISKLVGKFTVGSDTAEEELTISKSMLSFNGVSTDKAGNTQKAILSYGGKTAEVTVNVKASKTFKITSVVEPQGWIHLLLSFNSETPFDATKADSMIKYMEMHKQSVPDKTKISLHTGNFTGPRFFVGEYADKWTLGDTATFKKGMPLADNERLAESVTYVYSSVGENGKPVWEILVEPESFELDTLPEFLYANTTHQIVVLDDENVTAVYKFESSDTDYVSVDVFGVLTARAATPADKTVKITVSYKELKKEFTLTVKPEQQKSALELEGAYSKYLVPVGSSFASAGYKLTAHYVYADGSNGVSFELGADAFDENFDYNTKGERTLTITDPVSKLTATVQVEVYEITAAQKFNSIGVAGYAIFDNRNPGEGTWNGNMMIGAGSYTPNNKNALGGAQCDDMKSYVTYTSADGNSEHDVGLWMLGGNILIFIDGHSFAPSTKYKFEPGKCPCGTDEEKLKDCPHYVDDDEFGQIYMLGDKITFAKGMPLYAWHKLSEGENDGYWYVCARMDDDYTYYCHEQDDVKSLWQYYKEYTDFTVVETMTITAGMAQPLGAKRIPEDATTGVFTYVSEKPDVVTINASGTMVGLSVGQSKILVKLVGGKDENGNPLEEIVREVLVTVKRGISKIEGNFTLNKGSSLDLSSMKLTVHFSDGTTEQIALSDERVTVEDISTSELGETSYNVSVTVDGETRRGTITVNVVNKKSGCGCKSQAASVGSIALAIAAIGLALIISLRRKAHV